MTELVSATLVKPAFSNSPRVPTKAIVRSTFRPWLSTGIASTAGAPCARAKSTAPSTRAREMPRPRKPGRTLTQKIDQTGRSSTASILVERATGSPARGAMPAQPQTSSPS